ncbi:MAG: B12-binding domain-containing protein [Cohaesibacteraceae bacterium]
MTDQGKQSTFSRARGVRLLDGAKAVEGLLPILLTARRDKARQEKARDDKPVDPKLVATIEATVIPHLLSLHDKRPAGVNGSGTVEQTKGLGGPTARVGNIASALTARSDAAPSLNGSVPDAQLPSEAVEAKSLPTPAVPSILDAPPPAVAIEDRDYRSFVRLLRHDDAELALEFVEGLVIRGVGQDEILLDLCTPAARELGDMWCRDDCSFCEVTIGLSVLETVMQRMVAKGSARRTVDTTGVRRVLLLEVAPTQHVFGLMTMKALFLQAGWEVHAAQGSGRQALLDAAHNSGFTVIGLSVGSTDSLTDCQSLIREIRGMSGARPPLVAVGGPAILNPSPATRALNADLLVRDGREGLQQLERMVSKLVQCEQLN